VVLTVCLITGLIILTVIIQITFPPGRYALVIGAFEFRLRAFSVSSSTHACILVAVVSTIILEITEPSLGNTFLIPAGEFSLFGANRTIFRQLIRAISAVIFSITEQPLGNTSVIVVVRAPPPSIRAVSLTANMSRLVTVVPTVVVKVAMPQFEDTFSVVAREFGLLVAFSLIAFIFIGSIQTIRVSVTLPGSQNAFSIGTLELMFGALMAALFLIAVVSTIVSTITKSGDQGAIVVFALELTISTDTFRACAWFI